jgi:hypothetical protein
MFRPKAIRHIMVMLLLGILFGLFRLRAPETFAASIAAVQSESARAAVTAAWQRAQVRGSYHFAGDVVQVTVPEATLVNVGRTSRQERLYLEGESDLRKPGANLRLWSDSVTGGGSALVPASGIEVQVADRKTRVRRAGGDWQDSLGAVDGYAPQGDFMAYLRAARDITPHGPETRQGLTFTRYSFSIDGPTFAAFARDQMQKAMQARDELAPGMMLEISPYYAKMTGDGELWIDQEGLPLRQVLHLRFPPQRQEQVSAQISVTFHGYAAPVTGWAWFGRWTGVAQLWQTLPSALAGLLLTALAGAAAICLLVYRRRRGLQNGLAISLVLSMVVGPLLSGERNAHFFDVQRARAAAQESQLDEQDMVRKVQEMSTASAFDPHADALAAIGQADTSPSPKALLVAQSANAAGERGRDTDNDGLRDVEEELANLNPNLIDSDANGTPDGNEDLDGDGLSNFQEASLGSELRNPDTDGDKRSDLQELQPFPTLANSGQPTRWSWTATATGWPTPSSPSWTPTRMASPMTPTTTACLTFSTTTTTAMESPTVWICRPSASPAAALRPIRPANPLPWC